MKPFSGGWKKDAHADQPGPLPPYYAREDRLLRPGQVGGENFLGIIGGSLKGSFCQKPPYLYSIVEQIMALPHFQIPEIQAGGAFGGL